MKTIEIPTYSFFTLEEGKKNYLELIDGHGLQFWLHVDFLGQLAKVQGKFGDRTINEDLQIGIHCTVSHVFPMGYLNKDTISVTTMSWAWASLYIPPYTRIVKVQAYGDCKIIAHTQIDQLDAKNIENMPESKGILLSKVA